MKIVYSKILPFPGFIALNLFGILIVRDEYRNQHLSPRLLNHEAIHTEQMKETLYIGFYVLYFIFWLFRLLTPPLASAYRDISFEQEAYENQNNLDYLKTRQPYAWIWYQFTTFQKSHKKPLV